VAAVNGLQWGEIWEKSPLTLATPLALCKIGRTGRGGWLLSPKSMSVVLTAGMGPQLYSALPVSGSRALAWANQPNT
jgi:hypothetical protein